MLPDVIRTNRAYQIFLVSTVQSFTGSTVHVVAASWLILQLTGAAYTVPLLLLFSVIPGVVLAPVVGWLADRFDSRMLLVTVDLVSAGVVTLVPVMAWADLLRPWHLYAVEIAVSIAGQFYGPASRVFVWRLAQPDELLAANSAVTLVYQLGIALGALAGGALVATAGAVTGLVVNAASFAVSAVGMTIIGATRQWRERRAIKTAEPVARAGMWRGLAQTARMAFQQRRIRHMTLLYLGVQSVHRLLSGLLVPFVAATGLGPGSRVCCRCSIASARFSPAHSYPFSRNGSASCRCCLSAQLASLADPVVRQRQFCLGEFARLLRGRARVLGVRHDRGTRACAW